MKKNLTALIIAIVILVLTMVSFFGVWYGSHFSLIIGSSMNSYDNINFLTEGEVEVKNLFTGISKSSTYNYNDIENLVDYQDIPGFVPSVFDIYNNTFFIMIILVLISVFALICYLLLFAPIGNTNSILKVGGGLSLLIFIVSIFAVCYFAIHYTILQNESIESIENLIGGSGLKGLLGFWSDLSYTEPITNISLSYNSSPGYAWYLMILNSILSIIGFAVIMKKKPMEDLS